MATLRMSRRSGQIKLRSCVHLTEGLANFVTWMVANCCINWHLTVAKCTVPSGLSHHLCCNKRAFRICVAGCFNCTEGDPSLVAVTLRSNITLQSSLATCHPVQCSPNMRVADCATVWVCKCLQLIYQGALHLTLKSCSRQTTKSTKNMVSRSLTIRLWDRKLAKINAWWMDAWWMSFSFCLGNMGESVGPDPLA